MTERLLNAEQVAVLLAVPESWVRRETRAGRMPVVRLGRYRRYEEAAVLEWVASLRAGSYRKHEPTVRQS